MMQLVVAGALGRSFRRSANEEAHRRALWQRREQKDRDHRQKQERLDQSESDLIDLAATVITTEQAELFQSELDTYNEATYEALRENEELLENARAQLQTTLSRAHVLDDGRRVFKTEDGLRVFDEHGNEVGDDIVEPDEIPDEKPTWEQFVRDKTLVRDLTQQREDLLEFQTDLDEAQELLDSGEMTQAQYDELRERLAADAPDAVKKRIPELASDQAAPASTHAAAPDIDLDDELAEMHTPKPLVPGGG